MKKNIGKKQVFCVLGGIGLFFLAEWMMDRGDLETYGYLPRNSYGHGSTSYELDVVTSDKLRYPMTVDLGERQYNQVQSDQVFDGIMSTIGERILGSNHSLAEIRTDLNLVTWLPEEGVRIRWSSEEPDIIDGFGHIRIWQVPKEGVSLYLNARLSVGRYNGEYQIPVKIYPVILSEEEAMAAGVKQRIAELDVKQQMEEGLRLPNEYDGEQLHYREQATAHNEVLLVLGVVLAVLCYAKDQMEEQEKRKKRNQELMLDYAEIVFKLKVFIGAGMTVLTAWEKLVSDYEKHMGRRNLKSREAYEEMHKTMQQIQCGIPEGQAYIEFGNRCQLQPYRKLSSLLEQNRRTGSKNLNSTLEIEMQDAWEQRKAMAKRMGEEAGSKLLIPLFLMLGVVMVLIMVPAMLSMT